MAKPAEKQRAQAMFRDGASPATVSKRLGVSETTTKLWRAEWRARNGKGAPAAAPPTPAEPSEVDASTGQPGPLVAFRHPDAIDALREEGRRARDRLATGECLTALERARERKVLLEVERALRIHDATAATETFDWGRLSTEELETFVQLRRKARVQA